jgi:hypothetical protein
MIIVYPIGIPILYLWLLRKCRSKLVQHSAPLQIEVSQTEPDPEYYYSQQQQSNLSLAEPTAKPVSGELLRTRFLWNDYELEYYYWEVVECIRRMFLTGFIVFIYPNTATQAAVGCVFAVVSMVLISWTQPHAERRDCMLYLASCIVIALSFYLMLMIRVDVSGENSQNQNAFSGVLIVLSIALVLTALWQVVTLSHEAFSNAKSQVAANKRARIGPRSVSDRSVGGVYTVRAAATAVRAPFSSLRGLLSSSTSLKQRDSSSSVQEVDGPRSSGRNTSAVVLQESSPRNNAAHDV